MLLDFPGLRWRGSLTCPQHGDTMLLANKVFNNFNMTISTHGRDITCQATRFGDMFMERSACPKCRPETRGLGA
ncbi:unnamed protein product, partial [Ectocarpus sp. 12 AP-2014]